MQQSHGQRTPLLSSLMSTGTVNKKHSKASTSHFFYMLQRFLMMNQVFWKKHHFKQVKCCLFSICLCLYNGNRDWLIQTPNVAYVRLLTIGVANSLDLKQWMQNLSAYRVRNAIIHILLKSKLIKPCQEADTESVATLFVSHMFDSAKREGPEISFFFFLTHPGVT